MKSRLPVSLLAGLPVVALLLWLPAAEVRADVTISTATTAPQYGDGGTFTVTTSGTITSGGGDGVVAQTGNAITTLTVNGVVDTSVFGVRNFSGSTISGVGVSGTIQGLWGLLNEGAITSMSNGGLINGTGDWGIQSAAGSSFGTLTNTGSGTIQAANYGIGIYGTSGTIANAGLVKGTGGMGLWTGGGSNNITLLQNTGTFTGGLRGVQLVSGTIATFDNAGLVNGDNDWGFLIESAGSLGALTNSGTIRSAIHGIGAYGTSGTISNSGLVSGPAGYGLYAEGSVSQFSNTGRMTASVYGAWFKGGGLLASASNSGLISGGERAFQAENGPLGTLSNSGTMSGGNYGILLYGVTGTVANRAGALISATTNEALYLAGPTTLFSNAGTITAGGYGVAVYNVLTTATNSGLISATQRAFHAENTSSIGTLANSGTMTGGNYGILLNGVTGTVANLAGGRIAATTNDAVYVNGPVTLLDNAGTITAGNNAVQLYNAVTTVTNSGLIEGVYGIKADRALSSSIGVLTNSGTIRGTRDGAYLNTTGTVANLAGGLIQSTTENALHLEETVTLFTNAGTIFSGSNSGHGLNVFGDVTTAINSGLIEGGSGAKFLSSVVMGTLTNSGTIRGADYGIYQLAQTGTISNLAAGLIQSTGYTAIYVDLESETASLANAGRIIGAVNGISTDQYGVIAALTNSGTISGVAGNGVELYAARTMDSLTNSGLITGVNGIFSNAGTITSLVNQAGATISGSEQGISIKGSVTSLSNAGTIAGGSALNNHGVYAERLGTTIGTITTLVNQSGGRITAAGSGNAIGGGGRYGSIDNYGTVEAESHAIFLSGTSGSFTNRAGGVVRATTTGDGFYVTAPLDTFTNESGALIESASSSAVRNVSPGRITSLTNAGVIRGTIGLENKTTINTLTNSGTFSGTLYGISKSGSIGTFTNQATGLIHGDASGLYIGNSSAMPGTNAGRITGGTNGFYAYFNLRAAFTNLTGGVISGTGNAGVLFEDSAATFTNQAGGLIESAQGSGVYVGGYGTTYTVQKIDNAGLITGGGAGVRVQNGLLQKLANTGTLSYTGAGTGPAVFVGPGGVLGVASGTSGVALSSTGATARLNGGFQNQGTVYHGFTVDNQDVTISAGGGAGTFTDGTLTVTNGNLSFTSGTSIVAAGVAANSGAGLVTNEAGSTVRFVGLPNRTANFQSIANSGVVEFQQAVAGSLAQPINGTGSVLKTGTGDLTLAGTSSYTGATTVSAGRLSVNGILGNTPMAVLAAAELGGSGAIGGPVSVANGGFLSPGNSIESLATGTVTFAAGATFEYEVNSTNPGSLGTAADLLVVRGDLNLDTGNGSLLTVTDLAGSPNPFVGNTTMFALINYSGLWNGGLFTYAGNLLTDGGMFTVGSQQWLIDYNSSTGGANFASDYLPSGNFVTITAITAVPEPSTCIMALAGLACGGFSMWRRRKRA